MRNPGGSANRCPWRPVGDLASLSLRPDLSHYVSAMYKYVCSVALGGFTKMHLGKTFRTTSMCVPLPWRVY